MDEADDAQGHIRAPVLKQSQRLGMPLLCQRKERAPVEIGHIQRGARPPDERAGGGIALVAAAQAAGAGLAARMEDHVADLPGKPAAAAQQAATRGHGASDARAQRDHQHIRCAAGRASGHFAQ